MIPNHLPPPSGILVDLDGTLVDSEPAAHRSIEFWCQQRGIKMHPEDPASITGVQWIKAAERLAKRHGIPDDLNKIEGELLTEYRKRLADSLIEVPGARAAILNLRRLGLPIGLVSGSRRRDVFTCLDFLNVRSMIHPILGAEDYPASKPDPSGYQMAASQIGVLPSKIWVFEDSCAGIQSARSAGMTVIAITCTNHDGQDQSQAHAQIRDWLEVSTWFPPKKGLP